MPKLPFLEQGENSDLQSRGPIGQGCVTAWAAEQGRGQNQRESDLVAMGDGGERGAAVEGGGNQLQPLIAAVPHAQLAAGSGAYGVDGERER